MAKKRRTAASRTAARKAREAKKARVAKIDPLVGEFLIPGRRYRACFHSNHELVIEWNHNHSRLRVRSLWGSITVQPTTANEVEIS